MLRFTITSHKNLDIDDFRLALLNYLTAKVENKAFVLRIDNCDKSKFDEELVIETMQILEKCAIVQSQTYYQSERLHLYKSLASRLLKENKAYLCTCSHNTQYHNDPSTTCNAKCAEVFDSRHLSKLLKENTPFKICLNAHEAMALDTDYTQSEDIAIFDNATIPSASFCAACDDMIDEISTVITHASNRQEIINENVIKKQLGFISPITYHLLDKIQPDTTPSQEKITIKKLLEEGFLPDAIINYILIASIPTAPSKIFTLHEALSWFDVKMLSSDVLPFDKSVLREINKAHLKAMDGKKLSYFLGFADAQIGELAKLYLGESETLIELEEKFKPLFAKKSFENTYGNEMRLLKSIIKKSPMINEFDTFRSYLLQKSGLKQEKLDLALQLLLAGTYKGPKVREIYPYIKPYLLEVIS